MKLETLEIGTRLKVIKDIYYITEDSMGECSFLTKDYEIATSEIGAKLLMGS